MKEIKLTQNKVTLVDDLDFEYLNQWKWFACKQNYVFYAYRNININGKKNIIGMHRVIMNNPIGLVVDHKDHNGLNNQRSNLRICTRSQNNINKISFGFSKYKGVYFSKSQNKWTAEVGKKSNRCWLGYFKTETEAALAHDIKAKELHGEFAYLNFK